MAVTGKEALTLKQLRNSFIGGSNGIRLANVEIYQSGKSLAGIYIDSKEFMLFTSWTYNGSLTQLYGSIAIVLLPDQLKEDEYARSAASMWGVNDDGIPTAVEAFELNIDWSSYAETGKICVDMYSTYYPQDSSGHADWTGELQLVSAYAIAFD